MTEEFLLQATAYLRTEYNNRYKFDAYLHDGNGILIVYYDYQPIKTIPMDELRIAYLMWLDNAIIRDCNQYTWQKELIDIIEGS